VEVDGRIVGKIDQGLVVLAAVGEGDGEEQADLLVRKIAHMRIFADEAGKFNLSLIDVGGAILLISQFTLYADCRKGRRPSFSSAARPQEAERLIDYMAERFRDLSIRVETGVFGAMMKVALVNDGPVTVWLDTKELSG